MYVLPDRTSETFAAWLTEHPGPEIVCRNRAGAYTKAVRAAARNCRPSGMVDFVIRLSPAMASEGIAQRRRS